MPQLEIKNIVTIVFFFFFFEFNATHIADWFNVGASTIRKYVNIVCDVLIDKK
jgi:hypothetical protein